jgi:hypothetical protein
LHAINLKENPKAAFLLVDDAELVPPNPDSTPDHHVHVNMVCNNYEGIHAIKLNELHLHKNSWAWPPRLLVIYKVWYFSTF